MSIEDRLAELERRFAWTEHRQGLLIALVDPDQAPWAHFCLENNLDTAQASGIAAVIERAHTVLESGKALEAQEFSEWLVPHIPADERPGGLTYSFIQRLLIVFTVTGQWYDVCDHFRREFNVPTRDRLACNG
jgi:hypothetical protein